MRRTTEHARRERVKIRKGSERPRSDGCRQPGGRTKKGVLWARGPCTPRPVCNHMRRREQWAPIAHADNHGTSRFRAAIPCTAARSEKDRSAAHLSGRRTVARPATLARAPAVHPATATFASLACLFFTRRRSTDAGVSYRGGVCRTPRQRVIATGRCHASPGLLEPVPGGTGKKRPSQVGTRGFTWPWRHTRGGHRCDSHGWQAGIIPRTRPCDRGSSADRCDAWVGLAGPSANQPASSVHRRLA